MGKTVVSDDEDEYGNEPIEDDEEEYGNEPVEEDEEDGEEVGGGGDRNGGGDDEDEDEEDEEGQDEYEKDGFIVDDVEEEDEDQEEEEREASDEERQKKKRKKKEEYVLDEDDYALLEDNIGFHRPKENKKFKRLKKAQRDAVGENSGFSDEENFDGNGASGRTAEEKLKRSLFGDDDGVPLEDIGEEDQVEEEEEADIGDEDEMADFIVEEDEDDVNEDGVRVRRKKYTKKKSRQAPGVSSTALQEAHEIFGDVEELLQIRKQGLDTGEWKERRLEDEFEPIILSEKYMTDKDNTIRKIDIPERMQISDESIGPPKTDKNSLIEESDWIYNQIKTGSVHLFGVPKLSVNKGDIHKFLELQHVQKLDIPFIAMYRKEDCASLLKDPGEPDIDGINHQRTDGTPAVKWHKVLWAVQDLDRKWRLLQKRKSALESYYNKRFVEESHRIYDESRLSLNEQLFKSIMKSLKEAETEREVDDVDAKFNLHFPVSEVGVDEDKYKRPKRKSLYSICSKAGLWEVANKFGCTSEQFGMILSLEKMRLDEVEDAKETPEEVASNFTCAMFESPQAVLKGARHMAAVEISCEPCVRKYVRSIFMEHAVVSTTPTAIGNEAIDSFHQFAGVKWLQEKPLSRFEDAQWLLIQKAEEEKFLQVTIKLPDKTLNKLISDCNEYYLSMGVSKSAQLWNEQRKSILQDAIFNYLIPSMEKEARSLLSSRAKSWLLGDYGNFLWNKVSVGPYQRKENDSSVDDEAAPRVMACCWGPGKPATTFVMLDSSGEVVDVLYAGSLTLRSQNVNDQQKKNDQQRVLKFMTDHQPHVVVLGAVNLSCTRLKENIYEIIFKMVEENPRDVGHEMDGMSIVWGDESLPRLYENSRISSDQLPGQPGIVRRAAALGRYLQNPLAMVATLCGPVREVLSWKHSSLEQFLNPDEKYGMVEQVMVDVTNQVGIDINLAINHEWLFSPLQFISGLGPRKAASLQRSLVRDGVIYTRKDFFTEDKLDKKVFVNAVGFLRVRRSGGAASSSQFIDLLDDTRIHPESYGLAQELAKAVYEEDIRGDANDDEDALEMAIEHVRDKPYLLKSVNIEEYCREKNRENKNETVADIVRELIQGFQDWRKQYEEPNQDDEFYMISGETEETLAVGRIVQATVRRVQAQRAICNLDSGLTGMLSKEDYSDNWRDIADLADVVHEGDILTCKIKSIQKNRYQVFLVCKESEMRSNRYQHVRSLDPYYQEGGSNLQNEKEKAHKEKELAKKNFKPRMIVHPRFQNISADEAKEFLSDKEPGESIIHPSFRGPNYLTLTLKIYDGVYAHKDIVEGGKDHKDITSLLRIGRTLKIGDDSFEDLDEVMDRYVDPLVSHLKAMLNYRKFKKGSKSEVDELLNKEKEEYRSRIVYCFGIAHQHPGTFILTYIRSTNPHHEYIALYPKGFKFRRKMFDSIDRLVAYFQKHINDPLNESARSIRSVAAMVPMRSPANDGSTGSTFGSGWGGSGTDGGWRGRSSDRERSSAPSSRTGRTDYRQGGGREGHPSGLPRPFGGRGRGRGSRGNSERQETGYNSSPRWDSGAKGGSDSWGNFPGAKVQDSPGREAFPGGWGTTASGSGGAGAAGWGGGAKEQSDKGWGASGWDQDSGEGATANTGWGGDPKKGTVSGRSGW